MPSRARRTFLILALVAVLALVAGVGVACSAQASGAQSSAGGSPGTSASGSNDPVPSTFPSTSSAAGVTAAVKGDANDDWTRVAQALAWMRDNPPSEPIVVLLGGSAARESTVDDGSWRDQIVAAGGPATLAWNMGSHNRTMAQNLAIVKALPAGAQALVYIGINLGSFTSTQKSATISLPSPAPAADLISLQQPHQYGMKTTGILSKAKKQALVRKWLSDRYPVYKANFSSNAAILVKIIKLCQTRGYKTVLLELPRNSSVIGSALNAPTTKYRDKCKALATAYGVKWVPQLAAVPNADFYDLWHLVEPGRDVWQPKLSARTAALLGS